MPRDPLHEDEVLSSSTDSFGATEEPPHARGVTSLTLMGKRVPDDRDTHYLRPDILFQGSGPSFPELGRTADIPSWSLCTAPADCQEKKNRRDPNGKSWASWGTYAEQVFISPGEPTIVPTFHLNEHTFRFFLFDRGGSRLGAMQ